VLVNGENITAEAEVTEGSCVYGMIVNGENITADGEVIDGMPIGLVTTSNPNAVFTGPMPMPISSMLRREFTLERRGIELIPDTNPYYRQTWTEVQTLYGQTKSLIGTWPKYRTNPNNSHVFYCEYDPNIQEGDRLCESGTSTGPTLYIASVNNPAGMNHHLEIQCFQMPDELDYQKNTVTTDVIGGETVPTWASYLTDIAARIDVPSAQSIVQADKLGLNVQYEITIHATALINFTGRFAYIDQFGTAKYLKINTIRQPDIDNPWMIIGAEDL
jgi:head-tail adaptor